MSWTSSTPEPGAGHGQTLHDVPTAEINYADTHH
jgi:hypothetical protein